jgi:leucyl aminopeptidase
MGLMSLDTYKTEDQSKATLETMVLADPSRQAALESGGKRGLVLGEAANTARSLVNEPGNDLYPAAMAEKVKALAEGAGLSVEVLTASQMRDKGMGLLLAVGQGSDNEPRLVTIRYGDFEGKPTLGFVGKGITFDSGGISLKPGLGMQDMKTDMSGAAAVAGAMLALAQLKPQVNVLGVIPMAENMPSGKATRPGDVVRGMNGKTVEVVNTDAEGRMILADALVHAQELGATHIVDLATLTGACVVALGHVATGAMGKPQEWVDQVMNASRAVGEKIWQLPIYDEYRELIKSEIADMENAGGRWAGPITGAWFLKEFVKDETAWVHLDIAGTATIESDVPHLPKGASGVGVRALVRLAEEIAAG